MLAAAAWPLLLVAGAAGGPADVAPAQAPEAPAGCLTSLRSDSVRFERWPLRPSRLSPTLVCEAPEGVSIRRGPTGLRFAPPARVNCAFALRLARFERILQEEAKRALGSPVRSIVQLGTYNCRRMAAYPDMASEHSFANAIDISTFVLGSGRRVVVERDWVPAAQPAPGSAGLFLRRLTRRLYDERVFSVVLTPSFDSHHRNHLHLDGAAYSVDGT